MAPIQIKYCSKVLVLNEQKDRLLTLQRSKKDSYHPGNWSFPGGMLEGFESIIACALREVKEETGLQVRLQSVINSSFFKATEPNTFIVVLTFYALTQNQQVTLSEEHDEFEWISLLQTSPHEHIEKYRQLLLNHLTN